MKHDTTPTQFATRFSFEDWSWLCTSTEFLSAVEAGEFVRAETISHQLMSRRDEARIQDGATAMARYEDRHQAARQFVQRWATALGRTGGQFKQSRQTRIRRLVKRGLDSEYARKMAAEAGL